MSGKSYSIKEMKTIVDYLKTHSAYGDIKGRKMWMDFASSSLTNRTWQSLKETFLKRILPDIHNPYYNLTRDEILSFKQGFDINTRRRNKLEIHTISDDSSSNNAENQKDHEQPSKVNGGGKSTGENSKSSKIDSHDRNSTETVILEPPCYETAQDIERVLESPKNGNNEDSGDNNPPNKSLRDFITYAEPLTPMLQAVLEDFTTDDEEPELQIVENVLPDAANPGRSVSPKNPPNNIMNSETREDVTENNISKTHNNVEKHLEEQVPVMVENSNTPDILKIIPDTAGSPKKSEDGSIQINSDSILKDVNACNRKSDYTSNGNKGGHSEPIIGSHKSLERNETQNSCYSTSDTILPANQEALNTNVSIEKNMESLTNPQEPKKDNKKMSGRKRANSDVKPNSEKNRKRMGFNNKLKSVSEAGSSTEDKQIDFKIPSRVKLPLAETFKSSTLEKHVKENLNTNDTVTHTTKKKADVVSQSSQMNPCLNSVSLYAEKFNKAKYTDSESSENSKAKKNVNDKNNSDKNKNDTIQHDILPEIQQSNPNMKTMVMVSSRSESSCDKIVKQSDENNDESRNKKIRNVNNSQRDRALANVFGFACGASRKRKLNYRKSSQRYYSHSNSQLDSSEYTSDSEDEYISPPRERKGKQPKKYLKPKSARILSVEDEGGLFVMGDKRIYAILKDGKTMKNLAYSSESDTAEDPSYWKKKYENEKIKAEGLKKLLEETKENNKSRASSPILPITSFPELCTSHAQSKTDTSHPAKTNAILAPSEVNPPQTVNDKDKPAKTLKIKFTKNNEELQVEGHWSHIHPVLADVVQLFNKDSAAADKDANVLALNNVDMPPLKDADVLATKHADYKSDDQQTLVKMATDPKADGEAISSGSTAVVVDEEVHDKVAQLESEIFKEIEEKDKETRNDIVSQNENVNKRRGRQRKSPATKQVTSSSASETRTSLRMKNKSEPSTEEVENTNSVVNNKRKTSRKKNDISVSMNEENLDNNDNMNIVESDEDMSTIRYKLPTTRNTREKELLQKSAINTTKSKLKINNSKSESNASQIDAPVNLSLNNETTEGYQDSDFSPLREIILLKRKRNLSVSTTKYRGRIRRRQARRSHPCLSEDASSESSNLSFRLPTKITDKLPSDNSSLNTEVYRTDSYQLLVPKEKRPFKLLDIIDEATPNNDVDMRIHDSNLQVIVDDEMFNVYKDSSDSSVRQNSSSVSLPLSPELSVVENISIRNELLLGVDDHPTINETQANNLSGNAVYNKYMMSEIDVTMPLMAQDCEIQRSVSPSVSLNDQKSVSESMLGNKNSVNLANAQSISESLDSKLRNLLLESAKKMEVDTTEIGRSINSASEKKIRAKKRCSTPLKKTGTIKYLTPNIEPVVEEEHMECCSYGGRRSCPPVIQMFSEDSFVNNEDINASANEHVKIKGRKKKDIIKVKILKPKLKDAKISKSPAKCISQENPEEHCNISVHTDSGINEPVSGLFVQNADNDSVDLIHNHSETCLQTKECFDDSFEYVEPQARSIISLNTDSEHFPRDNYLHDVKYRDAKNMHPELHCNNAHDGFSNIRSATSTSDTVYHSPISVKDLSNSLITEDLSDESPCPSALPSKWYLFSEDEATNTINVPSFGANLMHIFPLACAVPNLSTVTEMSKENDGPNPSDIDGDTRNDLDSPCIFNV